MPSGLKLFSIKLKESVRINNVENHYYKSPKTDIYLENIYVKLIDTVTGDTRNTSIFNAVCWDNFPEQKEKIKK